MTPHFIDSDNFCKQAVLANETVIRAMRTYFNLSKEETSLLRLEAYPKIADYLLQSGDPDTASSVLFCFLETSSEQPIRQNTGDYQFTQNDLSDGFAQFKKSESFKGIVKGLDWSRRDGYNRDPDPSTAAKALFCYVTDFLRFGEPQSSYEIVPATTNQSQQLTQEAISRNFKMLSYHGERLARIIEQQPGSFIPIKAKQAKNKTEKTADQKKDTKDQDNEVVAKTMMETVIDRVDAIMLEAGAYLETVKSSVSPQTKTPKPR